LDVEASAFSVTVCQCFDFVCVRANAVAKAQPIVLCIAPVEEGASNTNTSPVNITNFNLTLSAPNIAFDVVTFGTDGPVLDPETSVDYDDGRDTVQIAVPIPKQFFIQGFTSVTAGGNAYLEFKTKGAQMTQQPPILAEYSRTVEIEENVPDSFITDIDTGYHVGTCQCINFVCVTGIPSPIAMSQPLVLCIFPLHEGELTKNVTITNFNLHLSNPDISYDPITFGTNAPVLDSMSQLDYDDGSATIQMTFPVNEVFFFTRYSSVNATGNAFLEFVNKGSKTAQQHPLFADIFIEVALEPLPQRGCFLGLIDKLTIFFDRILL